MSTKTSRRKRNKGMHCHECGKPIKRKEDFTTLEIYKNPWGEPLEIHLHTKNDICEDFGISCEQALYDQRWADFRYFDCSICNRIIILQCPSNGWQSYGRTPFFQGLSLPGDPNR
jgi:hypothetical protein